jgi:poly(3-hydroxybutyrate) depolymerase
MRDTPGHGTHLSYYQFGRTPFFASRDDQRFSYCLYVPRDYDEAGDRTYPLVVLVHGTERGAWTYRDEFAEFCEANGCVALAPLFPGGIGTPGELDGYKFIAHDGIRYDQVLLAIIDEVAATWRVDAGRFLLHGFSGGGHFTHRFLYLHPERLAAASIGAPGVVTLLDDTRDWWVGTADIAERFGAPIDLAALRAVPVQTVIGADDTETWEITIPSESPRWMPGADIQGPNRQDRIAALGASLARNGVAVRHDVVPGVAHDGYAVLGPVRAFFAGVLKGGPR